jgi:hypothetical protein
MQIQFVTLEIEHPASLTDLQQAIAQQLQHYGTPLRWAITAIDGAQQQVRLEAVVTVDESDEAILPFAIPVTTV